MRALSTPRVHRCGHLLRALCVALALSPLTAAGQSSSDPESVRWLAGCWEQRRGARVVQEQWMAPSGGMLLGMSRTVSGDVAREFELLRIVSQNGVLTYIAQPGGGAPTSFAATSVSDTGVVFANPAHDFPQRIMYRKVGRDSLIARIEGEQGGQVRGMDIPMRRGRCEDS
jgi:Domain of unknown function (DUF6265)